MKLEQNDVSLIFSQTSIPDVFFTEYLSQANGDFVKVYLYLYFLSKYNKDVKINDLSKKLELPLKIIQDAVKYWEEAGLLIRKNQGFIVANLQEIELNKVYKPRISMSAQDVKKVAENKYRAKAIDTINNEFFQGVMSPSWYGDIDLWFKKYGFDEEVMIALFRYCFNKSALHRSYISTVAEAWNKNKIKTFSDLDLYYQKEEKLKSIGNSIRKKMRISRNLSVYEEAYIEKWNLTYGYGLDIIDIALKKTTSKFNPSFEYLDKLISDWHERGLKTSSQVLEYIEKQKNIPVQKNSNNSTNSGNVSANYPQRNYSNLNSFYSNI